MEKSKHIAAFSHCAHVDHVIYQGSVFLSQLCLLLHWPPSWSGSLLKLSAVNTRLTPYQVSTPAERQHLSHDSCSRCLRSGFYWSRVGHMPIPNQLLWTVRWNALTRQVRSLCPSVDWGWGQLQCILTNYEKKKDGFLGENLGAIHGRKGNGSWTRKKTTEEYYYFSIIINSHNPKCVIQLRPKF